MAFTENLHPRGTGALGGQFIQKQGAAAKKTAPAARKKTAAKAPARGAARPSSGAAGAAGNLSFDGKRGAGYGKKNGDPRVHRLQEALNRLGFADASGKKLQKDGKLGPKTTAAIKRAQRALGLKPDGVVTPALLKKLTSAKDKKSLTAKPAAKKAPAKKVAPKKVTKAPAKKATAPAKIAPRKAAPVVVNRS